MSIGEAIIIASVINIFGMILFFQLRDRTWFKKENFKMQKTNTTAMNKLQLDRMRKELGLQKSKSGSGSGSTDLSNAIVSGLSKAISGEDSEGIGGFIGDWIEEHPEVIQQFLKGLSEGKGPSQTEEIFNA